LVVVEVVQTLLMDQVVDLVEEVKNLMVLDNLEHLAKVMVVVLVLKAETEVAAAEALAVLVETQMVVAEFRVTSLVLL
tara:strand:- start:23 stop:256 length:234 start_codon:yes stop_codon:yes gene_type:complete